MLIIIDDEWFDLHYCAMALVVVLLVFMMVIPIEIMVRFIIIGCLSICGGYFYRRIAENKGLNIRINDQQWIMDNGEQQFKVELNDYWLQTQLMCISLRGSERTISFVVSRSIIGAEKFSQLRAIIT